MSTKICTLDNCTSGYHARGMCRGHYAKWLRYGTPDGPPPKPAPPQCTIEDCEAPQRTLEMCSPHYNQKLREKKKLERAARELAEMECSALTCTAEKFKAKLCEPHYRYWVAECRPSDINACVAKYNRLLQSANPTKALLGEAHLYPAPEGEMHVAWPVSVTKGRRLDDRVLNGLTALALTWFETPPAKVGFQLTITRRGPLLLARAEERKTHVGA